MLARSALQATVRTLWYEPTGASAGCAVPYAVALDNHPNLASTLQDQTIVLVHRDDHVYVRALELQPVIECRDATALVRFTVRHNEETGYDENVDQQTLRVRRRVVYESSSSDEEEVGDENKS